MMLFYDKKVFKDIYIFRINTKDLAKKFFVLKATWVVNKRAEKLTWMESG